MDLSQMTPQQDTMPKHMAPSSVPASPIHQYAKQHETPICPPPTTATKSGVSTRSQTKLCDSAKPNQPSPVPQVDGAGDKPQSDDSTTLSSRLEEGLIAVFDLAVAQVGQVERNVDSLSALMKHDQGVG